SLPSRTSHRSTIRSRRLPHQDWLLASNPYFFLMNSETTTPRYLLLFTSPVSHLSIALPHHNVVGSEDRDRIGDHVAPGHMVECAHVNKRGRANFQTVGFSAAHTDDVESQFPLVRFGPAIDLSRRGVEALREELELLDHGFQIRKDSLLRRQRH